ncbi:MAG: hypothetical protein M3Y87_17270 [Myxococcota bacterium]|nr:hypothetical protein [Myxococcota bacterium]
MYEGQLAFYALGNHLKLQLRYAAATSEAARPPVGPGTTVHSGTAQLQLMF